MLTAQRLREALDYDRNTGVFTWRIRPSQNTKPRAVAGGVCSTGAIQIRVDGRKWHAHRLAWLHVHGSLPQGDIDHINLNRSDNRIANLREATRSQNCCNVGLRKDNRTGMKGVSKRRGQWSARITKDYRTTFLGSFDSCAAAAAAYAVAAAALHRDFARTD